MRIARAAAVALAFFTLVASADESPAEGRALAVIEKISASPVDDYGDLIDTHLADELVEKRGRDELQGMFRMLSANHSDIEVKSVEAQDNKLSVLVRDAGGMWLRFQFSHGPDPDHRITGFGVRMVPPPAGPGARALGEAEWLAEFDRYVQERVQADEFSGAIIVARGGEPVYARAVGETRPGVAMALDTPINLGSMNKMFTGVAVAQLVERGKLSYSDRVGEHLPDYPDAAVRDKVTVHQLLTHTAGLGHYWNDAYEAKKSQLRSVADFAALFAGEPLLFEPGERFHYSNNGPVVLGLIIEAITGMDYYDYVRDNVYAPAGMTRSGHYETGGNAAFATGYLARSADGSRPTNAATLGRRGSPAGGGYASANDLLRFSSALTGGRLLSAKNTETLLRGKVEMGPDMRYAYLFGDHRLNGHRFVGHNGGAPGINAEFSVFPELGYTVIVLANYDRAAMPVAARARELIAFNSR